MLPPNRYNLPRAIYITRIQDGGLIVSEKFTELLESGIKQSAKVQDAISELENRAKECQGHLTSHNAHALIQRVALWSGNNKFAQSQIDEASPFFKEKMKTALHYLLDTAKIALGLKRLAELPGLGFVIATNVYRFCCPDVGAPVNGRTACFFNALDIIDAHGNRNKATNFIMESSGRKLSVCRTTNFKRNRSEYLDIYLQILEQIANAMNRVSEKKYWRPAEVQMAVSQWWRAMGQGELSVFKVD